MKLLLHHHGFAIDDVEALGGAFYLDAIDGVDGAVGYRSLDGTINARATGTEGGILTVGHATLPRSAPAHYALLESREVVAIVVLDAGGLVAT